LAALHCAVQHTPPPPTPLSFPFLARSVMLLLWFLVFVFGYLKFENIKNLNKDNKKNPMDTISFVQSFSCF
jgi:hypothetical protein